MSHTIKLEDHVYESLQNFQDKRETFSQTVERLLALPGELNNVLSILEGQAKFEEFKRGKPEKITTTH